MVQRRLSISTFVLFALASLCGPARAEDHPNVLFIVSDDLNCDLGCYGHPLVKSPNIDRLAARGVRFDRAYCQFPLCNPSRASFLTGMYTGQTGVIDNQVHFRQNIANATSLPQLFQKHDYSVTRIGKLYHYGVPNQIGTAGLDDPQSWQHTINPKGRDRDDQDLVFSLTPGSFGGTLSWLAADGEDEEQTDAIGAIEATKLLKQYGESRKPFFLAVGFYRPHTPYVAPKKYFDMYPREQIKLAEVPADDWDDLPAPAVEAIKRKKDQLDLPEARRREAMQAYYAAITFMDAQVGRVLNALDEAGLAANTVVVFTSDHGYHMGEHGWWQKTTLFENAARVPLVIAGPGVPARGESTEALAELVDVYPTLSDLAGLEAPAYLPGKSLKPALQDPSATVRDSALTRLFEGNWSIRTDRWRYTEWNNGEGGRELYDHENDPGELTNLAEQPEHRETVEKLSKLLHERIDAANKVPDEIASSASAN